MRESALQMPHLTQTADGQWRERMRGVKGMLTWERREEQGENAEEDVGRTHCGSSVVVVLSRNAATQILVWREVELIGGDSWRWR